jgi:hypothetical protein
MLYKTEWNHKVCGADVSSTGEVWYSVPRHFGVRLLSSQYKLKKITFWAMLGMLQLLNILTFGILFA